MLRVSSWNTWSASSLGRPSIARPTSPAVSRVAMDFPRRSALGPSSLQLPHRPEQNRRQQCREEAIKAKAAEIHHVAHTDNVGEGRNARKNKKRNPDPTSGRSHQQNRDEGVKNGANVTIWNAKGAREWRVRNIFTAILEDRAYQAVHKPALIEPHIEHGRSADSCNAERDDTIDHHQQPHRRSELASAEP